VSDLDFTDDDAETREEVEFIKDLFDVFILLDALCIIVKLFDNGCVVLVDTDSDSGVKEELSFAVVA
jgi:hypothetical protein